MVHKNNTDIPHPFIFPLKIQFLAWLYSEIQNVFYNKHLHFWLLLTEVVSQACIWGLTL